MVFLTKHSGRQDMTSTTDQPTALRLPVLAVNLLAAVCALLIMVAQPFGWGSEASAAAALSLLAVVLWSSALLPEHITALGFLLGAMLLAVAPPAVVFSGFASGAFWLIFGGLVIGLAVGETGLGGRIARFAADRFAGSYARIVAGVVASGLLLGFLMPSSMGRVVLIVPIALALAAHFGFRRDDRGYTGIMLAAVFGAHIPTFAILPANVPNMVFAGAAESIHGYAPLYAEYLLLHFPVLGLCKAAAIVYLIVRLFPDGPRVVDASEPLPPLSQRETRLALVLAIALLFWLSDGLHGISPAWIALAAALFLLMPGVGLVSNRQFTREINFSPLFFVAGVLGMGAVIAESDVATTLGDVLARWLPLAPGDAFGNYTALVLAALGSGIVTTLPGVPAVLTPIAGRFAELSGLPVESVLMTQVLGFSTLVFPYQSPPLLVALGMAGIRLADALRLCLALTAVTVLLLLPLDFLWWRLLGWL